jgi:hypothetical protein
MMNSFLLLMSGPLMAALRYGVATGMASLATKYALDGATTAAIVNGVVAAATAGIGVLTSTKTANTAKVADIPGASVTLPNGKVVKSASEASDVIAHDPTWDNPNAR